MNNSITRRRCLDYLVKSTFLSATIPFINCRSENQNSQNIKWAQGWLLWRNYKGESYQIQKAVQDLVHVGCDGIEFSAREDELEAYGFSDLAEFKSYMDKNGLSVSGQYVSAPFYEKSVMDGLIDEIEPKIKMLKIFGSKNIVIGPPGQPKENDRIELIKKMAPVLNEFGKRMLDRGLEIGVHPHLNTLIETSKETDIIMEETDPRYVFMSPDTGHLYLAGGDVLSIFRKYKERLNYFHFKDGVRPFNPPNFKPNLRELGMGDVDFPGIMQLLKEINYTGWINIEQDHSTLTPTESCETSMKYVDQMLRPIYS